MKTQDFDYLLPEELIAQTPVEPRDHSRLLYLNKQTGDTVDKHFYDILDYLQAGDLLVVNNSRVLPARLYGHKLETGSHMELLLLEQKEQLVWETLVKPGKKAKVGAKFSFGDGLLIGEELMQKLRDKGVQIAEVTLHVGLGTFRPVKADEVTEHKMHSEHYLLPPETAELINQTKASGGRVIAVGTTSCRTLESVATFRGKIEPCEGYTDIFIYPGYEFKVLDGLITNFHLPKSTLIMLVSAFAGFDHTMAAYRHAVEERYRFFSFGDAMLIL